MLILCWADIYTLKIITLIMLLFMKTTEYPYFVTLSGVICFLVMCEISSH